MQIQSSFVTNVLNVLMVHLQQCEVVLLSIMKSTDKIQKCLRTCACKLALYKEYCAGALYLYKEFQNARRGSRMLCGNMGISMILSALYCVILTALYRAGND